MTYIVQADLEKRLTAVVVRQILDDDSNGTADTDNVTALIADAESYVEGFLRPVYDLTVLRAMGTNCPREVKRLSLDVAVAYAVDRHPDYVRADGAAIMERARRDLGDLRKGVTRLDVVGPPEPAANKGGTVRSGNPDCPEPKDKVFLDGLGDF